VPVHLDHARPRHSHEEHVYLIVDVLIDAPSRRKPHQVGVELRALLQGLDRPRVFSGGSEALVEVHYVSLTHTSEILVYYAPGAPGFLSLHSACSPGAVKLAKNPRVQRAVLSQAAQRLGRS
jgi:hypothetical protein